MTDRHTALLLVDLQVGLLTGKEQVHDADGLVKRIATLAEKARTENVPVLYVQDDDVGELDSPEWAVDSRVAPAAGERRIRKAACDAFHETGLDRLLREANVQHIVVAGLATEQCIDTTCRRAVTLGYDVTLIGDGHSTFDSEELSAEAVIGHHHRVLNGFGAYVAGRPCEVRVVAADEVVLEVPSPSEVQ